MRTIVSWCSREGKGLVRSTLLCGEKGRKQGRRRRGGVLVGGGGEGFYSVEGDGVFPGPVGQDVYARVSWYGA